MINSFFEFNKSSIFIPKLKLFNNVNILFNISFADISSEIKIIISLFFKFFKLLKIVFKANVVFPTAGRAAKI